LSSRILASDDSVAQCCGDRDEIEGRACATHFDARDGHGIQEGEATVSTLLVVGLKDRYSPRDGLSVCVSPLVVNKYQEDDDWVPMENADICLSNVIAFAANGKGDVVMHRYGGVTLIDTLGEA
jgi:hypothetical protein